MRVRSLELRVGGTLTDHHIVRLATALRLEGQQGPIGRGLASSDLPQRLASFDLGVDLDRRKVQMRVVSGLVRSRKKLAC